MKIWWFGFLEYDNNCCSSPGWRAHASLTAAADRSAASAAPSACEPSVRAEGGSLPHRSKTSPCLPMENTPTCQQGRLAGDVQADMGRVLPVCVDLVLAGCTQGEATFITKRLCLLLHIKKYKIMPFELKWSPQELELAWYGTWN